MKNWTTKDLLYLIFEFIAMVPDSNEWNEKSLKYNQPRLIRFRRISALFKAFELTRTEEQKNNLWTIFNGKKTFKDKEFLENEITPFLHGEYITKRKLVEYLRIQNLIKKDKSFKSGSFKLNDIQSFYSHLIAYRIEIDKVLRHNSGVLMASSLGFISAISLTNKLNNELYEKVKIIDEMLFEIINPKNLIFEEDTLIKKYKFPKEDLDKIDSDNW